MFRWRLPCTGNVDVTFLPSPDESAKSSARRRAVWSVLLTAVQQSGRRWAVGNPLVPTSSRVKNVFLFYRPLKNYSSPIRAFLYGWSGDENLWCRKRLFGWKASVWSLKYHIVSCRGPLHSKCGTCINMQPTCFVAHVFERRPHSSDLGWDLPRSCF